MKKKIFIFIILLCVTVILMPVIEASAEQMPEYTETTDEITDEENTAFQNFIHVLTAVIIIVSFMSLMMLLTKIRRKNIEKL